jgi:hypothetical protein
MPAQLDQLQHRLIVGFPAADGHAEGLLNARRRGADVVTTILVTLWASPEGFGFVSILR